MTPRRIEAGGTPITLEHSSPVVVDWNGDGLPDLLVAGWKEPVRLYLNRGTTHEYKLTTWDYVKADGVPIQHARHQICVADLNGDGKKDLIIGTNEEIGQILWYENIGTDHSPAFSKPVPLKSCGAPLVHRERKPILAFETRLCVTDWNNDGIPDLVVGDNSANTIQNPKVYCAVFLGKKPGAILAPQR